MAKLIRSKMRRYDRNLNNRKRMALKTERRKSYQCLHGVYSKWVLTLITVSTM